MAKKVYKVEDKSLFLAPKTINACIFAFIMPGAGHYVLGRKRKGMILGSVILITLLFGVMQGGDIFPFSGEGTLRKVGAFLQFGAGIPGFLLRLLAERGTPLSPTYDFGTAYLLIAGMLNWLCVVDSFDIAVDRK